MTADFKGLCGTKAYSFQHASNALLTSRRSTSPTFKSCSYAPKTTVMSPSRTLAATEAMSSGFIFWSFAKSATILSRDCR